MFKNTLENLKKKCRLSFWFPSRYNSILSCVPFGSTSAFFIFTFFKFKQLITSTYPINFIKLDQQKIIIPTLMGRQRAQLALY